MEYFSVKNWTTFQHYKDRNPPWIKLHIELLFDEDFDGLEDISKLTLMMIWLLASRKENKMPLNMNWLQKKLPITGGLNLDPLFDGGWLVEWNGDSPDGQWANRYVSDLVRADILLRDKDRCVKCKSKENLEIDHIQPISKGGTSEKSNLQTLCQKCNREKHNSFNNNRYGKRSTMPQGKSNHAMPEAEAEAERETEESERQPEKIRYGTHILLSKDEDRGLLKEFGRDAVDDYIKRVDDQIETTGKKYVSHADTIRKWMREDCVVKVVSPETARAKYHDTTKEKYRKEYSDFLSDPNTTDERIKGILVYQDPIFRELVKEIRG